VSPTALFFALVTAASLLGCDNSRRPTAEELETQANELRDARRRADADRSQLAADRSGLEADRSHREADRASDARYLAEIARANAEAERARTEAERLRLEAERARATTNKGADDEASPADPPSSRGGGGQTAVVNFASGALHANLRGGPGRRHEKLAEVPRGSRVTLVGGSRSDDGDDTGNWYRVSYNGITGWLHENSLER